MTVLTLATVVLDSAYAGKDKRKKHCAKRGRRRITSCKPGFTCKANKTLARAANIDEATFLCLNYRDEAKRTDNFIQAHQTIRKTLLRVLNKTF